MTDHGKDISDHTQGVIALSGARGAWRSKPPRWSGFDSFASALSRLDVADRDLAGATIFLGIEGDLLAFDQPTHSAALKRGGMDENVLAAIVRLNEAEAFLVVVEFHGARIHEDILSLIEVHLISRRARARP